MMYEYISRILRIIDGDTLILEISLGFNIYKQERIRIYNLNTKEIRKMKGYTEWDVKRGKEARDRAIELLPIGKEVNLVTHKDKQGKFGRFLGDVTWEEDGTVKSFTQIMKDEGHDYSV